MTNIDIFTDLADKYGNSINTTKEAEVFFDEFMAMTGGKVIVDFLDCDNDDHIEKIVFDHSEGLMTLYTRLPEKDPEQRLLIKSVLPFDTYSVLVRFRSVRFVRVKDNKCLAVVINGYTMNRKMIEMYAKSGGKNILKMDEKSSFFTSNLLVEQGGDYELMRAVNTPIVSFWLLPKSVGLHPQDSERYLYLYNTESLSQRLERTWDMLHDAMKSTEYIDEREEFMKMYGNRMRGVAEGLFKLVTCFYFKKYGFKDRDKEYNDRRLGDVVEPLKRFVYTSECDKTNLNKLVRVSNVMSHDTGLPVRITDLGEMYLYLKSYISDFETKVHIHDNAPDHVVKSKPSPLAFVGSNLKAWDFSEEVNAVCLEASSKCCFRLRINPPFHVYHLFETEDNYLCKDGKVRTLSYDDLSDALVLSDRNEVVKLEETIHNKITHICEEQGFDTDCYLVDFSSELVKCGKPTHLFTFEEIEELMRNADDSFNNKLVIDEDGTAHILQNPQLGCLYPVSIETWCAGNGYVGPASSLSEALPSYHLCLQLWLYYLMTGKRQYDDAYVFMDEEEIINKLQMYY